MNYILFFPDEMRAESLGCYGNSAARTPNIDSIAARGTLFEKNYTQHPVCGPSRACLATGWYPHVDGRRSFHLIGKDTPNFFTYLRDAGFTTCHAAKDDMFYQADMYEVFTEKIDFRGASVPKPSARAEEVSEKTMLVYPQEDAFIADEWQTAQSIDFINRHSHDEDPFFIMISWSSPHPAYSGSEKYYNMYDPATLPPMRDLSWLENKPELYETIREYRNSCANDEEFYKKVNAVYLGMCTFIDDQIGLVLDALKAQGIYDDTTLILCSDHGDFAGDAGLVEKWPSAMDDMITRVPLIISRPGAPAGLRVNTLTQSNDIMPTVCDFENVEILHDQFGVSLRAQVEGAAGDAERAVYCEGGYDEREPQCFEPVCFYDWPLPDDGVERRGFSPLYYPKGDQQQERPKTVCRVLMQRYKNWKLNIRTNGQNELYDMENDPREFVNLYGNADYAGIQNELTLKALTWLVHTSDVTPRRGRHW